MAQREQGAAILAIGAAAVAFVLLRRQETEVEPQPEPDPGPPGGGTFRVTSIGEPFFRVVGILGGTR